jgi:hypothetical protein
MQSNGRSPNSVKVLRHRNDQADIQAPVDIVMSMREEFDWRQEIVGTVEYPAVQEGRVLYARP